MILSLGLELQAEIPVYWMNDRSNFDVHPQDVQERVDRIHTVSPHVARIVGETWNGMANRFTQGMTFSVDNHAETVVWEQMMDGWRNGQEKEYEIATRHVPDLHSNFSSYRIGQRIGELLHIKPRD